MTKDTEEQNRRRFMRILFDAPASLSDSEKNLTTTLIDISLKGALLQRPSEWAGATGDKVELEVKLGTDEPRIRMHGSVAHIEEEKIGIQCDQIDIDSISHLRRLAELNLGDPARVERELAALG